MRRIVRKGLLVIPAVAALGGCVLQYPFDLPPLETPRASAPSSVSPYYGSGVSPYYGSGSVYSGGGYYDPRLGYYGYRYDPLLGYATPGYPYYYGPGHGYVPYPRAPYCLDANRNGRCDTSEDRDGRGGQGPGDDGGQHDGRGDLGRHPIGRLRDVGRVSPGDAVRPPASIETLRESPARAATRSPDVAQARPPIMAAPPRARPEPVRDGPSSAARSGRGSDISSRGVDAGPRTSPSPRVGTAPRVVER